MDRVKRLRSELERGLTRAWAGLTEGWRELLSRSSGALTHFVTAARKKDEPAAEQDFPRWSLLAGELWETASSIIVRVELPGMNKANIHVSIHGNTLRIRGEKVSVGDHQGRQYHLMERAYGRFERTIALPQRVDESQAEVSYGDGVVTVILQKTAATPPRRLVIK